MNIEEAKAKVRSLREHRINVGRRMVVLEIMEEIENSLGVRPSIIYPREFSFSVEEINHPDCGGFIQEHLRSLGYTVKVIQTVDGKDSCLEISGWEE